MPVQAPYAKGFTLVELLVTVSIIAVLLGILIPSVNSSRRQARLVACGANLRSIGQLIQVYAEENGNRIPRGPSLRTADYEVVLRDASIATNQVWTQYPDPGQVHPMAPRCLNSWLELDLNANAIPDGQYMGLGLLTRERDAKGNRFLYCPADDKRNFEEESAKIGADDQYGAYCSYLYRQMDMTPPEVLCEGKLDDLRYNTGTSATTDLPGSGGTYRTDIRTLAMDMNSLGAGVFRTTNHKGLKVNVVYTDGSVQSFDNEPQSIGVGVTTAWASIPLSAYNLYPPDANGILAALDRILVAADFSFPRPEPWLAPVPPYPPYPP